MKHLLPQLLGVYLASLLCVASARADPPADASTAVTAPVDALLVDLNTAGASELEQLPGIGPARAQAIMAFRAAHGGFTQVSQLMRIKGIGRAMLRKLRPFVTIAAKPAGDSSAAMRASP
jgi:competence protein ComEA